MAWSSDRLVDEIDLIGARGLPRKEFFAELSLRLRNLIGNDASCWHTLDPHTRLMTSDSPDELIERGIFAPDEAQAAGELLLRSEYIVEDVNTFAGLAARRVPVGTLNHVTRGDPQRSARYRDLLLPADIPHELRAAFVIRGRVWGAVHIARRAASGPFEQRDVDALAGVAGAIARGIRASLRFDAARRATGVEAPGLVVLGPQDEVELITPPARQLLALMRPDRPAYADDAMPTSVLALASFVRGAPEAGQGGSNVVTVPGSDGWITLHASLPAPPDNRRVAVVLERASGARSATVRLEAFGATAREREVATLLARGLSRAEIAEALVLSPHTVEDHLKSLYEKLGVASRQELVARLFLDEYLPEVARRTPLTSRGRFDRD
jgi:DNA-binding CsgD family transcriptional regulator